MDRGLIERAIKSFDISDVVVHFAGVSSRTVRKLVQYDLSQVIKFKPDMVILEIGANHLTDLQPEVVGSEIEELVCLLHESYDVKLTAVSSSIDHQYQSMDFNHKVDVLNQYLQVVLEPLDLAILSKYRGLNNPPPPFFTVSYYAWFWQLIFLCFTFH